MEPINADEFLELLGSMVAREAASKRMVPPKGSIPEPCCQNAERAGDKATKIHDSAAPLPEQGWGVIPEIIDYFEDKAALHAKSAADYSAMPDAFLSESHEKMAAGCRRYASALREITPRTQSDVSEDVVCPTCGRSPAAVITYFAGPPKVVWDCLCGTGVIEAERSGSGNDQGMAAARETTDQRSG